MADGSRRDTVRTTREYRLPNPTNWAELNKVLAWVQADLSHVSSLFDDTVKVSADDEHIILSYSLDDYPDRVL